MGVDAGAAGLVFFISAQINKLSVQAARDCSSYAARRHFLVDNLPSTWSHVTRVFFLSAAAFGAQRWGYDPAKLVGLEPSCSWADRRHYRNLVMFLRSSGLDWLISVIGVSVFAGLTTHTPADQMYDGGDGVAAGRKAVMGSLSLYLNFINLFMMILADGHNRRCESGGIGSVRETAGTRRPAALGPR